MRLRLILVACAFAGAEICAAQTSRPLGFVLRAGQFMPSAGAAREAGSSWMLFGAEVALAKVKLGMGTGPVQTTLTLSADTYRKGDFSATPVMLNLVTQNGDWSYSFGGGTSRNDEVHVEKGVRSESEEWRFAYHFSIGRNLERWHIPASLEIRYFGNNFDTLNGFAICLAMRV